MDFKTILGRSATVAALEALNTVPGNTLPAGTVRVWYDGGAKRRPELYAAYPFEAWLRFLEDGKLIVRQNESVVLTLAGREFLKYLVHNGYTLFKDG